MENMEKLNRAMAENVVCGLVVCYSTDWTRQAAVKALWLEAHPHCEFASVSNSADLYSYLVVRREVKCLLLDVTARDHVGLLSHLRQQAVTVPFIILQDNVRLSDEAVAEYCGRVHLIDTAGMRPAWLRECLVNGVARATAVPLSRRWGRKINDNATAINEIILKIERSLYRRLAEKIKSRQLCESEIESFARGEPVIQMASRVSINAKYLYHRRSMLCRYLGVHHRELPLSLTVTWDRCIKSDY